MTITLTEEGWKAKSAKGKDCAMPGGNQAHVFKCPLPVKSDGTQLTPPAINSDYMCEMSSTNLIETQCPQFLLELTHVDIFCLAYTKTVDSHCLWKWFRSSQPLLSFRDCGNPPESNIPGTSQVSAFNNRPF